MRSVYQQSTISSLMRASLITGFLTMTSRVQSTITDTLSYKSQRFQLDEALEYNL